MLVFAQIGDTKLPLFELGRIHWHCEAYFYATTNLQAIFMERQQALLHGDLHTGSFMVTEETTYAIDAEFAFYGPIAFDICKMIANLLLAFFASYGQEEQANASREDQRKWILQVNLYSHPILSAPQTYTCISSSTCFEPL